MIKGCLIPVLLLLFVGAGFSHGQDQEYGSDKQSAEEGGETSASTTVEEEAAIISTTSSAQMQQSPAGTQQAQEEEQVEAGEGSNLMAANGGEENNNNTRQENDGTKMPPKQKIAKKKKGEEAELDASDYIMYITLDLLLLCGAALFAGLTLGLMGLDSLSLEIISEAGAEPDRSYAKLLLPIRSNGNLLLCTLILGNVMVNTLVAQITDRIASGWIGVAVSTALITLGGEIIPQAFMSAHALKVGATMTPVVRGFLIAFYPICKPLSLFLDKTIGNDPGQVYDRNELRKLMLIHAKNESTHGDGGDGKNKKKDDKHGGGGGDETEMRESTADDDARINEGDFALMMGAMDVHEKTVANAMTPIDKVYMLEASERLNEQTLQAIWATGYSRIPVFRATPTKIIGLLYTKDLIGVQPEEMTRVGDVVQFTQRRFHSLFSDMPLVNALQEFKTGTTHFAIVKRVVQNLTRQGGDPVYETVGVVTLDDILETLLQSVLKDEFDGKKHDTDSDVDVDHPLPEGGGGVVPGGSATGGDFAAMKRQDTLAGHLLTAATVSIFAKKLKNRAASTVLTIDNVMNDSCGAASQSVAVPGGKTHSATARASVLRNIRRVELTENQAKAAAYFLAESLFPDSDGIKNTSAKSSPTDRTTNSSAVTSPNTRFPTSKDFNCITTTESSVFTAEQIRRLQNEIDGEDLLRLIVDYALSYEVRAPSNARGLSKTSKKNLWLYKKGVPSTAFTLIMGGGVQAILPSSGMMIDEDELRHQQMMMMDQQQQQEKAQFSPNELDGKLSKASSHTQFESGVEDSQPLHMELAPWTNLGQTLLKQAVEHYAPKYASEEAAEEEAKAGATTHERSEKKEEDDADGETYDKEFSFVPDFSARVVDNTRIIQFCVEDFIECCIFDKLRRGGGVDGQQNASPSTTATDTPNLPLPPLSQRTATFHDDEQNSVSNSARSSQQKSSKDVEEQGKNSQHQHQQQMNIGGVTTNLDADPKDNNDDKDRKSVSPSRRVF